MNRLQLADWNISKNVISNKNSRFFSNFWKKVFDRLKTKLLINIVWHSQINEKSKRINQIVKVVLRYLIIMYSNIDWIFFYRFYKFSSTIQSIQLSIFHLIKSFMNSKFENLFQLLLTSTLLKSTNQNLLLIDVWSTNKKQSSLQRSSTLKRKFIMMRVISF